MKRYKSALFGLTAGSQAAGIIFNLLNAQFMDALWCGWIAAAATYFAMDFYERGQ